MKLRRITMIILMLCSIVALTAGCGGQEPTETEEQEVATVQRGDLTLDISAVGNLALSQKESLGFELAGTVEEVLVEEGDFVKEGQVLAKLDTSERLDYLKTLERAIETKDQALLQAEINSQNAEDALAEISSEIYIARTTAQRELEVANAKISLDSAQSLYDRAKERYDSNWTVPEYIMEYEQRKAQLAIAEANLAEAEDALAKISSDIEIECEKKQKELAIAQSKLEDAQLALDKAVEALDEAESQNWNITTPFDGFITKVNISEGTDVTKGTAAIEIAEPNEFEANVYVSEMDIFNVAISTSATVQVDAVQAIILPAEVIRIAPTATIQSGVVNYAVKVKIQSIETIAQTRQGAIGEAMQEAAKDIASGELPEMLKRAVEAGRMTQEEAEEMMESGDFPAPRGDFEGEMPFAAGGDQGQTITTLEDFQLREGLTVTVSIITENRSDVLLVPSAAINTKDGKTYVTVILADGNTEERAIQTGLSDWQNTEVTGGLGEGEQVVVPLGSSSTITQSQGGFMIPGMGRMR